MNKNYQTVAQYQYSLKFNPFNISINETKLSKILWESAARYALLEDASETGIKKNKDEIADMVADLIKAPKADVDKVMDDLAKSPNADDVDLTPIEDELEKAGVDDLEEGVVGLSIAIASLIPKFLELLGDGTDFFRRKTGITDDNWKKEAQAAKDVVNAKKAEMKKFKKALERFSGGDKEKPGTSSTPESIKRHNEYLQTRKQFKAAREAYTKLDHDYDDNYGYKFFKTTFKQAGHKLHELYITPIMGFLKVLGFIRVWPQMRDIKKREKVANIIYSIAMVALAGYGVWSHLAHAHGLAAYASIAAEVADGGVAATSGIESALELSGLL